MVEDHDNKSTYNSWSLDEISGSEIDATASEEVKKLARRMAKKKLLSSPATRNESLWLELSGFGVGLDSRRVSLVGEDISTHPPLFIREKDEGRQGSEIHVVVGVQWCLCG